MHACWALVLCSMHARTLDSPSSSVGCGVVVGMKIRPAGVYSSPSLKLSISISSSSSPLSASFAGKGFVVVGIPSPSFAEDAAAAAAAAANASESKPQNSATGGGVDELRRPRRGKGGREKRINFQLCMFANFEIYILGIASLHAPSYRTFVPHRGGGACSFRYIAHAFTRMYRAPP